MRRSDGTVPHGRGPMRIGQRLLAAAAFGLAAATVSFPGRAAPAVPPQMEGTQTLSPRQVEERLQSRLLDMRERRARRIRRGGGRRPARPLDVPRLQMPPAPASLAPGGTAGGRRR
jgi:hypothetical protein